MKILHTADWHLGQTFFTYDRREEHEAFLEWLREQVRHVEADVLLISGDVFDTPIRRLFPNNFFTVFCAR